MAAKNMPNSKNKGDTKNIEIKDSSEVSAVIALSRAIPNSSLVKDQDSLSYEKELQISDEHLHEVKKEMGVSNEVNNILGSKSSTPSVKTVKTVKTAASAITNITVKEEMSNEDKSSLEVPAYTPTPIKPVKAMNIQAEEVDLNSTVESQASSDENKDSNKIIRLATKKISDEERKKLRAKRFNIIVVDSCENTKSVATKKISTLAPKTTSSSTNYATPTYDILKKRAERFGENVSTVMKSLDHKEKILKRKLKFLESVTTFKELEIKKKRAERFRMV